MIKVSQPTVGEEEVKAVREAFSLGYFGLGSKVIEFEEEVKKYLGVEHVVAVNTGSSALHLAVDTLGIGKGDEVIVPSLTFVACFQAVSATGATPIPCDVYPGTLLIDIEDVERKITSNTRAIMPVHYTGNPCNMDALLEISKRRGIRIIEDAAHAFGSLYNGKLIGSFGDITCFSFDSIKTITCGEGGAIVCRDWDTAEKMRQKRLLGIDRKSHASTSWKERSWFYEVSTQGFRYHMSNINAAIGLAQLKKLPSFIKRRREICKMYDSALAKISGIERLRINYDNITPFIYVICVKEGRRNDLQGYLKDLDIESGINYVPNHLHPFFRRDGVSLPETERAFSEILNIPLHCNMTDADVSKVIEGITAYFNTHGHPRLAR